MAKRVETLHHRNELRTPWERSGPWTWITTALALLAGLAAAGVIWAGLPGRWFIAAAGYAIAAGMYRQARNLARIKMRAPDAAVYRFLAVALLVVGTFYLLIALMAL